MIWVYYILVAILVVDHQTSAQECKPQSSGYGFTYPRIFTVIYDGPSLIVANRSVASAAIGKCFDPDDIAKEMFAYFEAHGADLSEVKSDPFNRYDNDIFEFISWARDPKQKRIDNVMTATLYDASRFTDKPLYTVMWRLTAKKDLSGPKGSLLAGHRILFGAYRFLLHNRDFCMHFTSASQVLILDVTTGKPIFGPRPFHLELKNKHLGQGEAIGLVIVRDGSIISRLVLTFPAGE